MVALSILLAVPGSVCSMQRSIPRYAPSSPLRGNKDDKNVQEMLHRSLFILLKRCFRSFQVDLGVDPSVGFLGQDRSRLGGWDFRK